MGAKIKKRPSVNQDAECSHMLLGRLKCNIPLTYPIY